MLSVYAGLVPHGLTRYCGARLSLIATQGYTSCHFRVFLSHVAVIFVWLCAWFGVAPNVLMVGYEHNHKQVG